LPSGGARAVTEIGQRITEKLQQGDSGIMDIVVGPKLAAEPLDMLETFSPEECVVLGLFQPGMLVYGFAFIHASVCIR
jgi:hypothetical protein